MYYVDNGKGYRRMFNDIADARKAAILLTKDVQTQGTRRILEACPEGLAKGVPIYTSAKGERKAGYVQYYDVQKKAYGFMWMTYNPAYGVRRVPLDERNGKVKR